MSSFHIWYSREARMYALLAFTTTLFLYAVLYASRYPNRTNIAGCALAGILLLYSHPYGVFVFAAVNTVVLTGLLIRAKWIKVKWNGWITSQVLTMAVFAPWAIILFFRSQHIAVQGFWIPSPDVPFVLAQLENLAGGRLPLIVLLVLVLLAIFRPQEEADYFDWRKLMLLSMTCVPILGGYLVSVVAQPIFLSRYLICVLPPLMLLAASGLRSIVIDRRVLMGAALGVVATFTPSVVNGLNPNSGFDFRDALTHKRESVDDFRSAVREFSKRYADSDRVLLLVHWHDATLRTAPFKYYWRDGAIDAKNYYGIQDLAQQDFNTNRLWIFSLWQPEQDLETLQVRLTNNHFKEVYYGRFGAVRVILFQKFDLDRVSVQN